MSQQAPLSNHSRFYMLLLVQTALTIGITLLVLKYSPQGTFLLQGPPGKVGKSCEVKTVRYNPSGSAVLAFQCGKQIREVTVPRGKSGDKGAPGAPCRVTTQVDATGGKKVVFQCGSSTSTLALPKTSRGLVPVAPQPPPRRVVVRPTPKRVVAATPPVRPAPRRITPRPPARLASSAPRARPAPSPSGVPAWGPKAAKITIVEFSDFQCPFCSRVISTIKRLKKDFGATIRVEFRHLPMSFHKDAHLAAQASLAAHAQGKFWPYHDLLFDNTNALSKADLLKYATSLKLNMASFKAALNTGKYKARVDADIAMARKRGATGTPTFFIKGQKIAGAYPYTYFKKAIEAALQGKKIPPFQAPQQTPPPGRAAGNKAPTFPVPDFNTIKVGNAPSTGNPNAAITIVEFSDFECSFCARATSIIRQLKQTYGEKVKIAFKHMPLPFHKKAHLAAQASMAAHAQGKFWAYHERLFQHQQELDQASLVKHAKALGLDINRFQKALLSGKYKAQVDADMQEGQKLRVRGTPTFFVNGYRIPGAFPLFYFKQVIEAVKAGKKPPAFKPPPRQPSGAAPSTTPVTINTEGSPAWGPKSAKVTIAEFSDFECSFCARASRTLKRVKKHFGDKIRLVFKHVPLSNHPNAHLAAQAAVEAHKQGKFWPFHELLFTNFNKLSRARIEALASQAGLDIARLRKALVSKTHVTKVNTDNQEATKIGAVNTPTFYVNGHRMMGAQPFFLFKIAVEAALAGRSIPKAIAQRGPKSTDPLSLNLTNAPTFGPKGAKVTFVEFSDFECGFCAGASKVVARLKKEYGKRVRFAFKHLPLRFHKKAKAAALAAIAAGEQGKFWDYHKLLFANQKELGDALYTRLAKQLTLNMKKFNVDRQRQVFAQRIDDDYAEGRWAGADGTPTVFINGKRMVGAVPYKSYKTALDKALKEAKK